VEKDGKVTANSYYRSNSQGVWRYLPDYMVNDNGEVSWLGKGYKGHSEDSLTLPAILQKTLSEITNDSTNIKKLNVDPFMVLAGTTCVYGRERGAYYEEIDDTPKILENHLTSYEQSDGIKLAPPETVSVPYDLSPDFSVCLTSWSQETPLYGKINIDLIPSRNGDLKYMFCQDSIGRAWIANIEDGSEISSTGLRKSWMLGENLTKPAFEYKYSRIDQTGGYGNDKIRNGSYVDMYENYLSKIPIIKEYAATKGNGIEKNNNKNAESIISSVNNFDELYVAVDSLGGLQGSRDFFLANKLKEIIDKVRSKNASVYDITNSAKLRDTVIRLMEVEKLEKVAESLA
jgi:hypothetical protein